MTCIILEYVFFLTTIAKYFFRLFFLSNYPSFSCLAGKTAIVTGGNAGIGYAISTMLASRGCKVIIADVADARQTQDTIIKRTGNKNVIAKKLDLSSFEAVREFAKDMKETEPKIDILVNNAGVSNVSNTITEDGLNTVIQTNFLGPFLLTHLLLDQLKTASSARIIFTGSIMAFFSKLSLRNIEDIKKTNYNNDMTSSSVVYQTSKLCNILAAQELAKKLSDFNIKVNSCDPGAVRTKLACHSVEYVPGFIAWSIRYFRLLKTLIYVFGEDKFIGAQTSFYLASNECLQVTGEHFCRCRVFDKPPILKNEEFCERIWLEAEEIVKLKPEEKI